MTVTSTPSIRKGIGTEMRKLKPGPTFPGSLGGFRKQNRQILLPSSFPLGHNTEDKTLHPTARLVLPRTWERGRSRLEHQLRFWGLSVRPAPHGWARPNSSFLPRILVASTEVQ